jgi:hypothetical protein
MRFMNHDFFCEIYLSFLSYCKMEMYFLASFSLFCAQISTWQHSKTLLNFQIDYVLLIVDNSCITSVLYDFLGLLRMNNILVQFLSKISRFKSVVFFLIHVFYEAFMFYAFPFEQ